MKNLWKLFAVAAVVVTPMTVNAAASDAVADQGTCSNATYTDSLSCKANSGTWTVGTAKDYLLDINASGTKICTAHNLTGLEYCVEKSGSEIKEITTDANITVNESIGATSKKITLGGDLTVTSGGKMTINADVDIAAKDLIVEYNGDVNINGTVNGTGNVVVNGASNTSSRYKNATMTIKANDGSVYALTATKVTVDNGGTLNVTNSKNGGINAPVEVGENGDGATLKVDAGRSAQTVKSASGSTVSTSYAINNTLKATDSKVTIDNGKVKGTVTLKDTAMTAKNSILEGTVTANDDSQVYANEINSAAKPVVNGKKAYVEFYSGTVTDWNGMMNGQTGIIKVTNANKEIDVYANGVDTVTLKTGETLIVDKDFADANPYIEVKAAEKAKIYNEDKDEEITVNVGGTEYKVGSGKTVTIVAGATEQPSENPSETPNEQPNEKPSEKPVDPDKVPDVPKTGDTVLVSTAVGLVSLLGLAATVKAKKFN